MKCPFCKKLQKTRVVDSRTIKDGRSVRRRRECLKCKERFTTYEELELLRLTVIKRDGTKEEYDRYKVENGLRKALEKRPVTTCVMLMMLLLSDLQVYIKRLDLRTVSAK